MSHFFWRPGVPSIGPPSYDVGSASFGLIPETTIDGHVPFDIHLLSWSMWNYEEGTSPGDKYILRIGGVDVPMTQIVLADGAGAKLDLSDLNLIVPGVTTANVDGDGLFGIHWIGAAPYTYLVTEDQHAVIEYEAVNAVDSGKEIHALGASALVRAAQAATTPYAAFYDGLHGSNPGFERLYELAAPNPRNADTVGGSSIVAAVPWPIGGSWSNYICVIRDVGGPDGGYALHFRQNGATKSTITLTNDGSRVVAADVVSWDVADGDMVNFKVDGITGTTLNAELLCAFRSGDVAPSEGFIFGGKGFGGRGF
jgi:hypothetical protein